MRTQTPWSHALFSYYIRPMQRILDVHGLLTCTATQTMYSFTSSFQSEWRPSSIHPSQFLLVYHPPGSGVTVYLTTVGLPSHLVKLKSGQLTPSQPWSIL